jgi:hypothetical protein
MNWLSMVKRGSGARATLVVLLLAAMTAGAVEPPAPADAETWRPELWEYVERARQETPEAFTRLEAATERAHRLEARKRGTLANVSHVFKELGPEALWPMVERLAFSSGKASRPGDDAARLALKVGLLEAAGELRDVRLAPLWKNLLQGSDTRPPVLRAAAGALARLQTREAAQTLIDISRHPGPRGEAAQEKLGECRRLVATRALADALDARPAPETARRLARALGDAGSAWAWQTTGVRVRSEEGAVRRMAAEALVRAYPHYTGDVRLALSNAVLRVDAPETPGLIDAAARSQTDEAQRAALAALAERLKRNPLR